MIWTLLGLLALAVSLWFVTITFGTVQGTEFCPQTFERRSYLVYELPLVGWQVSGIRRKDVSGAGELFIATQKYITLPAAGATEIWHIVSGTRGVRPTKGDAGILMQYLDAKDGDDYHRWVKWSEQHPKLAPPLWSAVQTLALHELYIFVPDLFDLAKSIEDPVKLRQELDRTVASKLLFLGQRLIDRGDREAAQRALASAANLDPSNPEIKAALSTAKSARAEQ